MLEDIFLTEGKAANWEEAIQITAHILEKNGCVKESFLNGCIEREKLYPTGLPTKVPIALPHTEAIHVIKPGACLLRLSEPVKFRNMEDPEDEIEVGFVFNIAIEKSKDQLKVLGAISRMFQDIEFLERARRLSINEFREVFLEKWHMWHTQ